MPFGIEVMGRVRELGSLDDVLEISSRLDWVRPVVDFAHMHATSDGAFTETSLFADALAGADAVSAARRSTSTSPTSRSRTATRRSTSPLRRGDAARGAAGEALAGFERGDRVPSLDRERAALFTPGAGGTVLPERAKGTTWSYDLTLDCNQGEQLPARR